MPGPFQQGYNWLAKDAPHPGESNISYMLRNFLPLPESPPSLPFSAEEIKRRVVREGQGLMNSAGLGWVPGDLQKAANEVGAFAMAPVVPQAAAKPVVPPPPQVKPVAFQPGAPQAGPAAPVGFDIFKAAIKQQESGGRYGVQNTEGSGASGVGQVMPDTERALARRIGIPYNPELSKGTGPEARQYQDAIFDAAAREAWGAGGGNPAIAASYYFGGSDRSKWKGKTQQYAQEVLGRMGGAGGNLPQTRAIRDTIQGFMPGVPAPHEEGYDLMKSAIAHSAAAATRPFSYSYDTPERPQLAEPGLAVQPDYGPADTAFQAGRPTNPFGAVPEEQEKNKLKMRRASYFSGLASGLANYREGQGLGQLFANMGGAALQGRFQGDENVRAKMEEFDENMARYNLAMANREEGKAKDFANIANDNTRTINRHNEQKYNIAMKEFDETRPQIDEQGRLVTTNIDPATGRTTKNVSTVDPTTLSKFLVSHAQNEINRYAGRTEAEQMEYRQQMALTNALIPQAMAEAAQVGDWQKRDQLAIYAGSQAAVQLVAQGTWQQAMSEVPGGAAAAAAMDNEAWGAAGVELDEKTGRPNLLAGKPTTEQQQKHDNFIASNLVGYFLDSGHMSNLVGGLVQDIIPGTGPGTGRDAMLPKGQPRYRYKGPSPTVTQSIEAFKAANTKRTSRETAKGVFDTETTDYAR